MNYLKQINSFYKLLPINPLSSNAQCLYNILLHINNMCNWQKEFTVANLTLMGFTCLNKQALYRARNELIQANLIKFKKGINQNQAGKYQIIEFVTADDTAHDTADDTADDTAHDTINKQNKTKQNKKENTKKKTPTLEEINSYIQEKGYNVDGKAFYDYFTEGNWKDSKGNAVKNWKQKIITWSKYSTVKKKNNDEWEKFINGLN